MSPLDGIAWVSSSATTLLGSPFQKWARLGSYGPPSDPRVRNSNFRHMRADVPLILARKRWSLGENVPTKCRRGGPPRFLGMKIFPKIASDFWLGLTESAPKKYIPKIFFT